MPIGAIEGAAGPSALWPSSQALHERMQKVLSVFATRLALRRDQLVEKMQEGRSLGEIAEAAGMSRQDAAAVVAGQLGWQPGRAPMDPRRLQSTVNKVLDTRLTGRPQNPALALSAAVASADGEPATPPPAAPVEVVAPTPPPASQQVAPPPPPAHPPRRMPLPSVSVLGAGPEPLPDPVPMLDGLRHHDPNLEAPRPRPEELAKMFGVDPAAAPKEARAQRAGGHDGEGPDGIKLPGARPADEDPDGIKLPGARPADEDHEHGPDVDLLGAVATSGELSAEAVREKRRQEAVARDLAAARGEASSGGAVAPTPAAS